MGQSQPRAPKFRPATECMDGSGSELTHGFPMTTISCSDVVVIRKYGRLFLGIRVLVEQIINLSDKFIDGFENIVKYA